MTILACLLLLASALGTACLLAAAWQLRSLGVPAAAPRLSHAAVSILKPLHGDEPALAANLGTFLTQDHAGPIQIVCGVASPDDRASRAVAALRAAHPAADIALVIDGTRHGTNAKVSNLINMAAAVKHDVMILSDSDMAASCDWLAHVLTALARPGAGAVTCLYRGRGDAGGWSELAAMGISQHFLPSVMLGLRLGLAKPCMGSTIALTHDMLARIGGFEGIADLLADDYAIGAAIRRQGLRVAVPPLLMAHGCTEPSLAALVRHELRWNRTVMGIDRAGFLGSIILHPLPLGLIALALPGMRLPALGGVIAAIVARAIVGRTVDRVAGERTAPLIWIPARDVLAFVLYLATFVTRSVDWRGAAFTIARDGKLASSQDQVP